jgi:hypothetical protein
MPKWLKDSQQLNAIARSRALMVLSVLSGEKPVTDAITEAKISRGTYYQMETRALNAMLAALNPLATVSEGAVPDLSATRIEALLERIRLLEQDKRRTQRLLLLTRKSIRAPLTTGHRGRISKATLLGSIPTGSVRSPRSRTKAAGPPGSIPTRTGETPR